MGELGRLLEEFTDAFEVTEKEASENIEEHEPGTLERQIEEWVKRKERQHQEDQDKHCVRSRQKLLVCKMFNGRGTTEKAEIQTVAIESSDQ